MSAWVCLGYMTLSNGASTVFSWLQDLVSVSALINWAISEWTKRHSLLLI